MVEDASYASCQSIPLRCSLATCVFLNNFILLLNLMNVAPASYVSHARCGLRDESSIHGPSFCWVHSFRSHEVMGCGKALCHRVTKSEVLGYMTFHRVEHDSWEASPWRASPSQPRETRHTALSFLHYDTLENGRRWVVAHAWGRVEG